MARYLLAEPEAEGGVGRCPHSQPVKHAAALVDCYPLAVLHQGLDRQKSGDAPLDIAAHILRSASPLSPPLVLETPALRLG